MNLNFVPDYLSDVIGLTDGDIRAALMLMIGREKQAKADMTDNPDKWGNYWSMTVDDWQKFGLGDKRTQLKVRSKLRNLGDKLWKERIWDWPAHNQYCLDIEQFDQMLKEVRQ